MLPGTHSPRGCLWRQRRAQFEKQRHVDYKGVEKVIRVHLRDTYPRRKKIARELKYFRRNRHRMRYEGTRSADRFRSQGSVQDSSNATHEEVRNAIFYPSALSCRAIPLARVLSTACFVGRVHRRRGIHDGKPRRSLDAPAKSLVLGV